MIHKYIISFIFFAVLLMQLTAGSIITCIDCGAIEDISNIVTNAEEEEEIKDRHNEDTNTLCPQVNNINDANLPMASYQNGRLNKVSIAPPETPPDLG